MRRLSRSTSGISEKAKTWGDKLDVVLQDFEITALVKGDGGYASTEKEKPEKEIEKIA